MARRLRVIDCEQGSPEWLEARLGIPTASEFGVVCAKGRAKTPSAVRRTYMLKLAGERLTGVPMETYTNADMERGHELEEEARTVYGFARDVTVERVGFMRTKLAGCSPDGVVGDKGLVEFKTKAPHLQLDLLLRDKVPNEHVAQLQGQLWVSGREWVDFMSYWPGLPPFIKRVERDEAYIRRLEDEVVQFDRELCAIVANIKRRAAA